MARGSLVREATTHLLVSTWTKVRDTSSFSPFISSDYVATIANLAGYQVTRQTFPHAYSETLSQRFVAGSPINITAMTVCILPIYFCPP